MSIPTPHIAAKKGEIAKTVLMPGDPLRSKFIAENFLDNAKLVNNVRGVQGYTGYYKGKPVTVMASGMGNPTIGIYSYELFKEYDVDTIIRVGSIGSTNENVKIKDIIVANKSYSNTNFDNFYIEHGEGFIDANNELVNLAVEKAKQLNLKVHVGAVLSSDTFYTREDEVAKAKRNNLLGVEMETAALFINAKNLNKKAVAICTVSDSLVAPSDTILTSEEREKGFSDMIKLALEML